MDTRYLLIGTAALALAGAANGAPLQPQNDRDSQPQKVAEVVMASAGQIRSPATVAQQAEAAPVKRPRAARVTSCRCAGQSPAPDQVDQ